MLHAPVAVRTFAQTKICVSTLAFPAMIQNLKRFIGSEPLWSARLPPSNKPFAWRVARLQMCLPQKQTSSSLVSSNCCASCWPENFTSPPSPAVPACSWLPDCSPFPGLIFAVLAANFAEPVSPIVSSAVLLFAASSRHRLFFDFRNYLKWSTSCYNCTTSFIALQEDIVI